MQPSESEAPKILVIGPSWVGDMVMAQPLFAKLKQNNPQVSIDVLAPEWTKALLARMPEVNQALSMPIGHGELNLFARYHLAKSLRAKNYERAIVLPNSFKSALIPMWAKIPKRTGWLGECRLGVLTDKKKLDKAQFPLMVERFVALADLSQQTVSFSPPKLVADSTNASQLAEKFNINKEQPILSMCPGAEYGPAKRWPAPYFAKTANYFIEQGWQVCLLGSNKDDEIGQAIKKDSPKSINLIGKTALADAIDLISLSRAAITNDSGLMHIAAALSIPLVAIFGSSDPRFTPPMGEPIEIISLQLSCSPCFKRVCPLKHMNCLNQLQPEQVIKKTQNMVAAL